MAEGIQEKLELLKAAIRQSNSLDELRNHLTSGDNFEFVPEFDGRPLNVWSIRLSDRMRLTFTINDDGGPLRVYGLKISDHYKGL